MYGEYITIRIYTYITVSIYRIYIYIYIYIYIIYKDNTYLVEDSISCKGEDVEKLDLDVIIRKMGLSYEI